MAANPQPQTTALALRPSGAVATALQSAGTALGMNLLEMVAAGKANLVSPALMLDKVPDLYRLAVRVVTINPEIETYKAPEKEGYVCLGATALQKISKNAQVDWESVRQIDDWRDPHRVKYQADGHVMNLDSTRTRLAPGVVVIDLRGEPSWPLDKLGDEARQFLRQAEKRATRPPMTFAIPNGTNSSKCKDCDQPIFWVPNPYSKVGKARPVDASGADHWVTCPKKAQQAAAEPDGWGRIYQARQFIDRIAATKAMSACIRKLGVPTSMPEALAAQPWVVMALVFDPPTDDPEIRRMLVAHALGAQASLYGPPVASVPRPAAREVESDVVDVSDMVEEPTPAEPCGETPAEEPPPAGQGGTLLAGVKIEFVSEKPGPAGEDGKPKYVRYGVKVGDDWMSTFSATMAATARAAKAQGATVTVEYTVSDEGYKNLTAITPGTQRDLPLEPPAPAPTSSDPWPSEDTGADLDACPLPLSDEAIFSVPSSQENRVKALGMLNAAFADLVAAHGEREARAIARKVAGGLDPVATPHPELRAIWEALRAELGGAR